MKRLTTAILAGIVFSSIPVAAEAGSMCNNGKLSSNSGRGTCSSNGGVDKSYPSFSDPGSSSYKRNNGLGGGLTSTGKNSLTGKSCRKGVSIC